MRLTATIAGLLSAAVLSACMNPATVTPGKASRGRTLVQALSDPKTRDAAYCELLALRLYHRPAEAYAEACTSVTQTVSAPQTTGPPLYIVFGEFGYDIEREPIRRGPAGPFTIFDSDGYIVPVFSSANMIEYESELFAYAPQGQIAIGHVFGVSHGSSFDDDHWSVQTLHVVPAAVAQHPALSVVLGPPTFGFSDECAGNFWTWRYRDSDGDGFPEVEIGPRADAEGSVTPAATFRWSSGDRRYAGPSGGVAEQFLQFRPEDREPLARYAEAWRSMRDKRTGYRLSWCRSQAVSRRTP